jgi:hypothetical protein
MPALDLLCNLTEFNHKQLSKKENIILEAEIYSRIADALWEFYQSQYQNYFELLNYKLEMEDIAMELNFIRFLVTDILKSNTYTLSGIACYTYTPEEFIQDLMIGHNSPVIIFLRKLIALHKSVKPELYQNVLNKIKPIEANN